MSDLVKVLLDEEQEFVRNLVKEKYGIYHDEIRHMEWHLVVEHPKNLDMDRHAATIKRSALKSKPHKRLVVLTKHRLLFIKRIKLSKKLGLHLSENLFNLQRIENMTPDLVLLQFEANTNLEVQTNAAAQFILRLRNAYANIAPDWDSNAVFTMEVDPSRLLNLTVEPLSVSQSALNVYYAKCDQMEKEPNEGFVYFVEDLVEEGVDEFVLSECPGVYPTSATTTTANVLHLKPLVATLVHSTYFKGLTVKDIERPDMFFALESLTRYNKTMTKLILSGLSRTISPSLQKTIAGCGRALAANPNHQVTVLDLSYTKLAVSGIFGFVDALDAWPHELKVLNLSNCNMKKAAVAEVWNALSRNLGMSMTLEEIIMDENEFDKVGSDAMSQWLNKISKVTPLRKLSLAGTKLDAHQAFHGYTLNSMKHIQYLNVSRNKLPAKVAQTVVAPVAYSSETLNQLFMADCDLDAESAMKVLQNISSNERLRDVTCDISDNKIGKKCINALKGIFVKDSGVQNIRHLDISGNDLYPVHLPEVVVAMRKSNIQVLSIGKGRSTMVDDAYLLECLRDNVLDKLRVLKMQGCSKTPEILLKALETNQSIVELDLSDFGLGDSGALHLSVVLRKNTCIQSIMFDRNNIGMNGYMSLRDGIRKNRTLKSVGYPFNDVKALQKQLSIEELAVLRSLWMDVEVYVRRNGGGWGAQLYQQFELVNNTAHDDYRKYPCPRFVAGLAFVPDDIARLPKPKSYRDLKQKDREVLEAEDAYRQDRIERGLQPEQSIPEKMGLSDGRNEGRRASKQLSKQGSRVSSIDETNSSSNNLTPPPPRDDDDDAPPVPPPDN